MSSLDNARETIDDKGLITGIAPDDTFSARIDQGIAKLQANDKFAGLAGLIQGTKQALKIQRANPNIDYDAGAEFTLKLTQPLNWRDTDQGPTARLEPFPNEDGLVMFHIQAYGLSGVERDSLLIPILEEQETKEFLLEASRILTDSIMNQDQKWRLRSAVPLWIVGAGDPDGKNWAKVRDLLTHPRSSEHLDGILVLAMRNREEVFCGTTLPKELNVQEIAGRARALQNPEPELRTPIDVAYQYLRSQLRMTAN